MKIDNDPDTQINPNKIMWWLLCTITSLLLVMGAAWGATMTSRQQGLEDRLTAQSEQQVMLDRRLSVIEGKLDILIQRSQLNLGR